MNKRFIAKRDKKWKTSKLKRTKDIKEHVVKVKSNANKAKD